MPSGRLAERQRQYHRLLRARWPPNAPARG